MAWFWTIIQSLIRLSAFFWSCGMIMLHGIWYKLEDWIKRCLNQTYHRLSQEYFKSYRIAFRVVLWLDFEQLSSYLFISRRLCRSAISKCYMEFDTQLKDWIKRYLIQTYQRLSQEYFKSYRIAFRVALWLDLNNYPVTYSFHGVFFELRYQNITSNLIQNWNIESTDILFKLTRGYLKSISKHIE